MTLAFSSYCEEYFFLTGGIFLLQNHKKEHFLETGFNLYSTNSYLLLGETSLLGIEEMSQVL